MYFLILVSNRFIPNIMDKNKKDGWPAEFILFPAVRAVERAAHFVGDILLHRHIEPSETPVWGAQAYLDEALDGEALEPTQPQLW